MSYCKPSFTSLSAPLVLWIVVLFIAFGGQQAAVKIANAEMAPVLQATVRSWGASLLLAVWLVARGINPFHYGVVPLLVLGGLFGLDFGFLFLGIAETTASRATILYYTAPLMMAFGAGFILRDERLNVAKVIGIVFAFAGAAWVVAAVNPGGDGATLSGDLLCLGAAISWAATVLYIRGSVMRDAPSSVSLFYQVFGSAFILPAFSAILGEDWTLQASASLLGSLTFQTVGITFLGYLSFFYLVQIVRTSTLATFTFISPTAGVLIPWIFLSEELQPAFVLGAILVVIGIMLSSWKARAAS